MVAKSESGSNVDLDELAALSQLTSLHIFVPNNLDLPPNFLSSQKLTNFILIKDVNPFTQYKSSFEKYLSEELYSSSNMEISLTNIAMIYDKFRDLVKRIERLTLKYIVDLESISQDLTEEGLNELKYLNFKRCDEISYLFNARELTRNSTFHNLEELHLIENYYLIALCNGKPSAKSFCKLKALEVKGCERLLNIAPSHLLQRFRNLQTLRVEQCRSLVYIFDCEKIKIEKGETKLLSSLEYLDLVYLKEMSHIWKGDHQSISLHNLKRVYLEACSKLIKLFSATILQSLICLEEVRIRDCYNLKEIFEKKEAEDVELDHTITSLCLGNLTSLEVSFCYNLEILFTPSIAKLLVELRELKVMYCHGIREIITNEKGEKETSLESITFPSLEDLELSDLNKLTCFSSGSYTIEFPKLKFLNISRCGNMKTFCSGKLVIPKVKKVCLEGTTQEMGLQEKLCQVVKVV
ncbi:uncharacterized protein LOC123204296 [Mangifera indica]|uniref:uncharacterized protein LOC123204296 n=1 Tax=Mangifera indica TaxID=29780 RepID=UPI001CFBDF9B|nr:uncharacterized protein LOC123204296 [Mangifera indica]